MLLLEKMQEDYLSRLNITNDFAKIIPEVDLHYRSPIYKFKYPGTINCTAERLFQSFEESIELYDRLMKIDFKNFLITKHIDKFNSFDEVILTDEEYTALLLGYLFNDVFVYKVDPINIGGSTNDWEAITRYYDIDKWYGGYYPITDKVLTTAKSEMYKLVTMFIYNVMNGHPEKEIYLSDTAVKISNTNDVFISYLKSKLFNIDFNIIKCTQLIVDITLRSKNSNKQWSELRVFTNLNECMSGIWSYDDRRDFNYNLPEFLYAIIKGTNNIKNFTNFDFINERENMKKISNFRMYEHEFNEKRKSIQSYVSLNELSINSNWIEDALKSFITFYYNTLLCPYINSSKNVFDPFIKCVLFDYPALIKEGFYTYKIRFESFLDKKMVQKLERKINQIPNKTIKLYLKNKSIFKKYLNNYLNGGFRREQWKNKSFYAGMNCSLEKDKRDDRHLVTMNWIVKKLISEMMNNVDIKEVYGITDSVFVKICLCGV